MTVDILALDLKLGMEKQLEQTCQDQDPEDEDEMELGGEVLGILWEFFMSVFHTIWSRKSGMYGEQLLEGQMFGVRVPVSQSLNLA